MKTLVVKMPMGSDANVKNILTLKTEYTGRGFTTEADISGSLGDKVILQIPITLGDHLSIDASKFSDLLRGISDITLVAEDEEACMAVTNLKSDRFLLYFRIPEAEELVNALELMQSLYWRFAATLQDDQTAICDCDSDMKHVQLKQLDADGGELFQNKMLYDRFID